MIKINKRKNCYKIITGNSWCLQDIDRLRKKGQEARDAQVLEQIFRSIGMEIREDSGLKRQ